MEDRTPTNNISWKQMREGVTRDACPVSVVILSYNSRDLLRRCVTAALDLDWPNLEVIVVDNSSSDGSPEMVASEFHDRVRIIRRGDNSPTAGRNEGFRAAKGKFILSLDDDIVLPDRTVVRKAISLFGKFPSVGLLTFKITSLEMPQEPLPGHWWHPVPLNVGKNRFFYTDFFCESAVFFRSEVLRVTGGYDEQLFQYFEGNDLALRMTTEGLDMLFCPVLVCHELRVRGMQYRTRTRNNYLSLRNKLWLAWKHFPLSRALCYASVRIPLAAVRSVRYGWVDYFWQAAREGVFAPHTIRAERRPLGKHVWEKIRYIRRGQFCDFVGDSQGSAFGMASGLVEEKQHQQKLRPAP